MASTVSSSLVKCLQERKQDNYTNPAFSLAFKYDSILLFPQVFMFNMYLMPTIKVVLNLVFTRKVNPYSFHFLSKNVIFLSFNVSGFSLKSFQDYDPNAHLKMNYHVHT